MPIHRVAALLILATVALVPARVQAHPHVWVTTKAVVLYAPNGQVSGVRHSWIFDESYSAFAVQGFEIGPDGQPAADKMAELAKLNMESLVEQNYFTVLKANGAKQAFAEPVKANVRVEDKRLVLTFDLPLKAPTKADRALTVEVYDPTFFVDFAIADGGDAVKLEGAPAGCALSVTRPKPAALEGAKNLSESFFSALNAASNLSSQLSSRILVACP